MTLMKLMAQTVIVCAIPKAVNAVENLFTPSSDKPEKAKERTPGYKPDNFRGETELEFTQRLLHTARTSLVNLINEEIQAVEQSTNTIRMRPHSVTDKDIDL